MSSTLPGLSLPILTTSNVPSLQEFVLQGSILDTACEQLIHRLQALCDNADNGIETFKDHEIVFMIRTGPNAPVILRGRRALDQPNIPWQLRYVGQSDVSDKNRSVTVRSFLDCSASENLPQFLQEIGFRIDYEFVAEGHMFRKGKMKITVSKIFKVPKPGQIDALEPLSMSRLVELSVVAPSGSETVADDMRTFAEQLKPLVTMDKIINQK